MYGYEYSGLGQNLILLISLPFLTKQGFHRNGTEHLHNERRVPSDKKFSNNHYLDTCLVRENQQKVLRWSKLF